MLDMPERVRDPELATDAREAVIAAITHANPVTRKPGPAGAAIALRASLDQVATLTPGERHLRDHPRRVSPFRRSERRRIGLRSKPPPHVVSH